MESATKYDYTSIADMQRLADRVRALPDERFLKIAPYVMAGDLMRTNLIIHLAVKLVRWKLSCSLAQAWAFLASKAPIFDDLKEELAKHIECGRDRYDKRSAAGLCKQEVDSLVSLIEAVSPA